MQEQLKGFIQDNKPQFDDVEPKGNMWVNIETELNARNSKKAGALPFQKLLVAAAIAALIISSVALYFTLSKQGQNGYVTKPIDTINNQSVGANNTTASEDTNNTMLTNQPPGKDNQAAAQPELAVNELHVEKELNQYTKLIEGRQQQLGMLCKTNPQLQNRFSDDMKSLEFSYNALKEKAARGANKELVLKAMIQNLQFQAELLNKQLEIIKNINNTKNSSNETGNNNM